MAGHRHTPAVVTLAPASAPHPPTAAATLPDCAVANPGPDARLERLDGADAPENVVTPAGDAKAARAGGAGGWPRKHAEHVDCRVLVGAVEADDLAARDVNETPRAASTWPLALMSLAT